MAARSLDVAAAGLTTAALEPGVLPTAPGVLALAPAATGEGSGGARDADTCRSTGAYGGVYAGGDDDGDDVRFRMTLARAAIGESVTAPTVPPVRSTTRVLGLLVGDNGAAVRTVA